MTSRTLISGQAGVAVLFDGQCVHSFHLDGPANVERSRQEVDRLFGDCTDIVVFRNLAASAVPGQLDLEWSKQRCLTLCLLLLDVHADAEARRLTILDLEDFLTVPAIADFVRHRLFAVPLPDHADLIGSINRAFDQGAQRLVKLLEDAGTYQVEIARCRTAWDILPVAPFRDESQKQALAFALVNSGAFHMIATTDAAKRGGVLMQLLTKQDLHSFRGWREGLMAWVNSITERNKAVNRGAEEEEHSAATPTRTSTGRNNARSRHATRPAALEDVIQIINRQKDAIRNALLAGNRAEAREYCADLVAYQERHSQASHVVKSLCDIAQTAKQLGYHDLQLEWAQRAVDLVPDDGWAHVQLGDAFRMLSRWDLALQHFALGAAHGEDVVARTGRAEVLKSLGRLDEALTDYTATVRDFPENVVARNGRAEVLKSLGRLDEALTDYTATVRDFPENVVARTGAASVCVLLADYETALGWLGSPAQCSPVNWVGLHVQAMIFLRTDRLAEAIAILEPAVHDSPFGHRRYFRSALAYARLLGNQPLEAARELEEESTPVARVLQIHVYSDLNQPARAQEAYELAIRLNHLPRIVELTAELGARARLGGRQREHSEEWVFDRELEMLLAA